MQIYWPTKASQVVAENPVANRYLYSRVRVRLRMRVRVYVSLVVSSRVRILNIWYFFPSPGSWIYSVFGVPTVFCLIGGRSRQQTADSRQQTPPTTHHRHHDTTAWKIRNYFRLPDSRGLFRIIFSSSSSAVVFVWQTIFDLIPIILSDLKKISHPIPSPNSKSGLPIQSPCCHHHARVSMVFKTQVTNVVDKSFL